ncbi:MAG: DUF3658 domain-containing protein [Pseudomonadota bacterium]|nr:DUF3658 domain-containing protein [Pseudomonadota bacterium]
MPGTAFGIPDDLSHGPLDDGWARMDYMRYDALLLESCAPTWTPAPRVVGTAMDRCDEHNRMSDLFFSSRLQVLIDAGAVEADGPS